MNETGPIIADLGRFGEAIGMPRTAWNAPGAVPRLEPCRGQSVMNGRQGRATNTDYELCVLCFLLSKGANAAAGGINPRTEHPR